MGDPRELLSSVLDRLAHDRPLLDLLGPDVDPRRVAELLDPLVRAAASIEQLAVNGRRVDAVLRAGDAEWRVVFGADSSPAIQWLDVVERPRLSPGVPGGHAIVVNGPSGAGKSTLMRALQRIATTPLVVLDEPEHIGTVQPGYLVWREQAPSLHRGYLAAAAALARAGNRVALSAAGHGHDELVEAFADVPMMRIGLTCDLDVLIERERRTDRWGGIAEGSLGVHEGWTYDLELDTTDAPDPVAFARKIQSMLPGPA